MALLLQPKVSDPEEYWDEPPPLPSSRCSWWKIKIRGGWQANRRIRLLDFEEASTFFGVYIWEYLHVIDPMLHIRDVIVSKTSNKAN